MDLEKRIEEKTNELMYVQIFKDSMKMNKELLTETGEESFLFVFGLLQEEETALEKVVGELMKEQVEDDCNTVANLAEANPDLSFQVLKRMV